MPDTKRKVGTLVKFEKLLDNDQYNKFQEFKSWLHYDELQKKQK